MSGWGEQPAPSLPGHGPRQIPSCHIGNVKHGSLKPSFTMRERSNLRLAVALLSHRPPKLGADKA